MMRCLVLLRSGRKERLPQVVVVEEGGGLVAELYFVVPAGQRAEAGCLYNSILSRTKLVHTYGSADLWQLTSPTSKKERLALEERGLLPENAKRIYTSPLFDHNDETTTVQATPNSSIYPQFVLILNKQSPPTTSSLPIRCFHPGSGQPFLDPFLVHPAFTRLATLLADTRPTNLNFPTLSSPSSTRHLSAVSTPSTAFPDNLSSDQDQQHEHLQDHLLLHQQQLQEQQLQHQQVQQSQLQQSQLQQLQVQQQQVQEQHQQVQQSQLQQVQEQQQRRLEVVINESTLMTTLSFCRQWVNPISMPIISARFSALIAYIRSLAASSQWNNGTHCVVDQVSHSISIARQVQSSSQAVTAGIFLYAPNCSLQDAETVLLDRCTKLFEQWRRLTNFLDYRAIPMIGAIIAHDLVHIYAIDRIPLSEVGFKRIEKPVPIVIQSASEIETPIRLWQACLGLVEEASKILDWAEAKTVLSDTVSRRLELDQSWFPGFRDFGGGCRIEYEVNRKTTLYGWKISAVGPKCGRGEGALANVFWARRGEKEALIVKFTTAAYGIAAHQMLAERGLAPEVIAYQQITPKLYVVVMRRLEDCDELDDLIWDWVKSHPKASLTETQNHFAPLIDTVRSALSALHARQLVHGDVRGPNILVQRSRPFLIDFDWAGPVGTATYPFIINHNAGFPKHCSYGDLILPQYDLLMLDNIVPNIHRHCTFSH